MEIIKKGKKLVCNIGKVTIGMQDGEGGKPGWREREQWTMKGGHLHGMETDLRLL